MVEKGLKVWASFPNKTIIVFLGAQSFIIWAAEIKGQLAWVLDDTTTIFSFKSLSYMGTK